MEFCLQDVRDKYAAGAPGARFGEPGAGYELLVALRGLKRQALHALRLAFPHPSGRGTVEAESPLPADIVSLLAALAQDTAAALHK